MVAGKVLPEYSEFRNPDAKAMCDLALYNYVEVGILIYFLYNYLESYILICYLYNYLESYNLCL